MKKQTQIQLPLRARRTVAAARLALALPTLSIVACDAAPPPDDTRLSELSSDERVALCDELRDDADRDDHPIECDGFQFHWLLPANQSCRDADVRGCSATAGDVRAWHQRARNDPCPLTLNSPSPDVVSSGCPPFAPALGVGQTACERRNPALLTRFDGVYTLVSSDVPSQLPCGGTLPRVLDPAAPRLVLATTLALGAPQLILQSCQSLEDCRALAGELRDPLGTASSDPSISHFNRLDDCGSQVAGPSVLLHSLVPEGVRSCEVEWSSQTEALLEGSRLSVTVTPDQPVQASAGCGYVVMPSSVDSGACFASARFVAEFESEL
ncbi:MAG TPA: hypothetical protein VMG12_23495 [Polyangiaceae bacterium]|nr:hypothetical protein [Polyangiaceae bacterium]